MSKGSPESAQTLDTLKTLLHHQRLLGAQVMGHLLEPARSDRLVLCDKVHRADAELRVALQGGGYLRPPLPDGGFTAAMVQDRRTLIADLRRQADVLRDGSLPVSAELMDQAAREMEYDLLAWGAPR